jgi:hypothetical protein
VPTLYQRSALARDNRVTVTRTLVNQFRKPVRRFISNLLNATRLFDELDSGAES